MLESCRAALEQSIPLRTLVVVDNSESPIGDRVVERVSAPASEVHALHVGANLGPAGGFNAGLEWLRRTTADQEWVLCLDDDDPLPRPDVVARLLEAVDSDSADPATLGGVGLMGARFYPPLLLTRPADVSRGGLVPADSLHGWAAPMYRARALEQVGGFRAELFWGLEELDLGIRLARRGWSVYVAADAYLSLPTPRKAVERPGRPRVRLADPSPRHYYRLRNTVEIGRRHFGLPSVAAAVAVRGFLKPVVNLPLRPAVAARTLKQNARAVSDGWRGRLGQSSELED